MDRRAFLALPALFCWPRPADAALRRYDLVLSDSTVAFGFTVAGVPLRGTMPIALADIRINPSRLTQSQVDVSLDARRAETKAYALAPMTGPEVLDVANHPTIRFRSQQVTLGRAGRLSEGASIAGALTLRDVTRPVVFDAGLYRLRGSDPADIRDLSVRLTATISRTAFGASGYAGLVADTVTLDITARIREA